MAKQTPVKKPHMKRGMVPKKTRKNVTLDFETDPFEGPNHPIAPFCCAFYDGNICRVFFGTKRA